MNGGVGTLLLALAIYIGFEPQETAAMEQLSRAHLGLGVVVGRIVSRRCPATRPRSATRASLVAFALTISNCTDAEIRVAAEAAPSVKLGARGRLWNASAETKE